MIQDIKGHVAVVTGGAQSMGLLTSKELVKLGAKVVIGDVLPVGAEEVAKINAEAGSTVAVFQTCDVCDPDALQALIDRAVSEFGRFDILVNNAGVLDKPWEQDPTGEYARRCIDINVRALIDGTNRALHYWSQEEGRAGTVVNLASSAGYAPISFMAAYTASKAAVVMYTKSLATLAPKVRVNAVAPVWVDTKFIMADHIGQDHYTIKVTGLIHPDTVVAEIIKLVVDSQYAGDIIRIENGKEPYFDSTPKSTHVEARLKNAAQAM